jgi:hypothetical protein
MPPDNDHICFIYSTLWFFIVIEGLVLALLTG